MTTILIMIAAILGCIVLAILYIAGMVALFRWRERIRP